MTNLALDQWYLKQKTEGFSNKYHPFESKFRHLYPVFITVVLETKKVVLETTEKLNKNGTRNNKKWYMKQVFTVLETKIFRFLRYLKQKKVVHGTTIQRL